MRTFAGPVLMGRVGRRRFNNITCIFKNLYNFGTTAKFTTKIKAYVAIRGVVGQPVCGKPLTQKIEWWSF
jgi:hypothetical protein